METELYELCSCKIHCMNDLKIYIYIYINFAEQYSGPPLSTLIGWPTWLWLKTISFCFYSSGSCSQCVGNQRLECGFIMMWMSSYTCCTLTVHHIWIVHLFILAFHANSCHCFSCDLFDFIFNQNGFTILSFIYCYQRFSNKINFTNL